MDEMFINIKKREEYKILSIRFPYDIHHVKLTVPDLFYKCNFFKFYASGLIMEDRVSRKLLFKVIRNKLHTVLTSVISAQFSYSNAIRQCSGYD